MKKKIIHHISYFKKINQYILNDFTDKGQGKKDFLIPQSSWYLKMVIAIQPSN